MNDIFTDILLEGMPCSDPEYEHALLGTTTTVILWQVSLDL